MPLDTVDDDEWMHEGFGQPGLDEQQPRHRLEARVDADPRVRCGGAERRDACEAPAPLDERVELLGRRVRLRCFPWQCEAGIPAGGRQPRVDHLHQRLVAELAGERERGRERPEDAQPERLGLHSEKAIGWNRRPIRADGPASATSGTGGCDDRGMQPNPLYRVGLADVRELATRAPWMLLVSHPASGAVASPSPVLVDGERSTDDELVLVTHLGRADARGHGLLVERTSEQGPAQMLVVVQGEHGYISPSWYVGDDRGQVPTWNFEMATLTCDVEVLSADENMRVLHGLVDHFERQYAGDGGVSLDIDDDGNRGMAMGTVGLRLRVRSFDAKAKMSQNKSAETRASVLAHLDASHPRLAARMRVAG